MRRKTMLSKIVSRLIIRFTNKDYLLRCLLFVTGMITAACGIATVTSAHLGTTPITSVPLVASRLLPLSVGAWTAVISALLIVLQKFVLGPSFRMTTVLQMLPVAVFSLAIDFWLDQTAFVAALPYAERFAALLLGIVILAGGILMQVASRVTIMPGEGIVMAIAYRCHQSFGSVKVLMDCAMVACAVIIGFIGLGGIIGIREGTLAAAVLTGLVLRGMSACVARLARRGAADRA